MDLFKLIVEAALIALGVVGLCRWIAVAPTKDGASPWFKWLAQGAVILLGIALFLSLAGWKLPR